MSAVGTTMTVVAALQAMQQLLESATRINEIVQTAQLEGRKSLTTEEWAVIKDRRDQALSRLDAAIKVAEVNGGPMKGTVAVSSSPPNDPTQVVSDPTTGTVVTATPPATPAPPVSGTTIGNSAPPPPAAVVRAPAVPQVGVSTKSGGK